MQLETVQFFLPPKYYHIRSCVYRTCAISLILALYMSKIKLPVPVWTRKKGCRTVRYPLHQVFAVIIIQDLLVVVVLLLYVHGKQL